MATQTIISQVGPLPIIQTFNAPLDGPVTFFLAGTGRSPSANEWIGVEMFLDGAQIGGVSVFCDQAQIHRSMIPNIFSVNLSQGSHTIKLVPLINSNTVTDDNDGFVVTLLY